MNRLSARTRIALGQACLLASILLVALALGVFPDSQAAVMQGRKALCESIGLHSSLMAARGDVRSLEAALQAVVHRNPDILSAGVRRTNGKLVAEVGDHSSHWKNQAAGNSDGSRVEVPLHTETQRWGTIEVRFRSLKQGGLRGIIQSPWTRVVSFVTAATLLIYMVYLGKVLEQLDPSKVVPGRVRNALNTLTEGLLVLDRSERIVLANEAFANLLGKVPDKLMGVRAGRLPWVRDDTSTPSEFPWTVALREGIPQPNIMIRLRASDGEIRTFVVNCSPVLGHDGKYSGVLASFDDVTQLERHKEALSKSKEEAEAANRAKSEFLARMSHEIRTPMNAILGFTEVLRRGFDCDARERQDYLNTIHASGQHLLNLINDILDLSKVEAGKLEIDLVRTSPTQIIHDVVSVLRVRAQEKGILLESEFTTELPESILTDPVRLRQMLMNLVGNAIKFTEVGGVRLVARFLPSPTRPRLAIDVVDTGIGISKEAIDKIFDPFVQADTSITRRFGGTGLGLSICRRFADALGGTLSAQSEIGVGSVFSLGLDTGPLEGVRLIDPRSALTPSKQESAGGSAKVQLPAARVLVVDDGAENRKLMTLVLRRTGLDVHSATNGQQALDLATQESFDIILMDIEMPVMDGYAAARAMRARGINRPIIALTAHAMKGVEDKCRAAGFSGYESKPINMDRLLATLARELSALGLHADPTTSQAGKAPSDATRNDPAAQNQMPEPDASAQAVDRPKPLPQPRSHSSRTRLVSKLPANDAEFQEIVREFVNRLREKLLAMDQAWESDDLHELARLAHWLKGSGGTAGFDAFFEPARRLERLAKENSLGEIPDALAALHELAACVELAEPTASLCA